MTEPDTTPKRRGPGRPYSGGRKKPGAVSMAERRERLRHLTPLERFCRSNRGAALGLDEDPYTGDEHQRVKALKGLIESLRTTAEALNRDLLRRLEEEDTEEARLLLTEIKGAITRIELPAY